MPGNIRGKYYEMATLHREIAEARRLAHEYQHPVCICQPGWLDLGCRACTDTWRPQYNLPGNRMF